MNKYIYCLFLLSFYFTSAQSISSENLAKEYYKNGDFIKASELFSNIYKKKKSKRIYEIYVDCLIKTQSYDEAEKIINSFYKKQKNPTILIDLAKLYQLMGLEKKAIKTFDLVLKTAKETPRILPAVASRLYKEKKYLLSLELYSLIKRKIPKGSYNIQIANIHSHLGDIEAMYEELIELILTFPNYFQTTKNIIQRSITDDDTNKNNQKLKKLLIKSIQKNNSYETSKLLVWLFTQEKNFEKALDYEISIDKRLSNNKLDILELTEITLSNKDYFITQRGLEYVLNNSPLNSFYYEHCDLKLINLKFSILNDKMNSKSSEINKLIEEHKLILNKYTIKSETISTLQDYCALLTVNSNREAEAIEILNKIINENVLNNYDEALCKIELAKILTNSGEMWDAILLYSQVEKEFKHDIIGQKAKFEKTKINYYNGDFEWAQNQLKILKLSTSKLIANNAMKLSLLISDNLNLDTTNNTLIMFAKAELLFEQKKYIHCLEQLDELERTFPNHSLIDEVLLKKYLLFFKTKEYEKAIHSLNQICENHYHDILYDDALFYQAQLYEKILLNFDEAKKKYEELLLTCPNSIFVNEARKRYRNLRKNDFLKL